MLAKILTLEITIFWLKNDGEKWSRKNYFEIPRAPSDIPANLSGQIFLHWAVATLKGLVEFQNTFFYLCKYGYVRQAKEGMGGARVSPCTSDSYP